MRKNAYVLIVNHVSYQPVSSNDIAQIDSVIEEGGREIEFHIDGETYCLTLGKDSSIGWAELTSIAS